MKTAILVEEELKDGRRVFVVKQLIEGEVRLAPDVPDAVEIGWVLNGGGFSPRLAVETPPADNPPPSDEPAPAPPPIPPAALAARARAAERTPTE